MLSFLAWHGILLAVSGQLEVPLSARSQGQTTMQWPQVRKAHALTLQEKLEALRMLQSGSLPSAIMYKFGVSSSLCHKIEEAKARLCLKKQEKNGHSLQSSPCVEANNRALLGES